MKMGRRAVVWFAVFAATLLVVASPASASTAEVYESTTDSDWNAFERNSFVSSGSGDSSLISPGEIDDFGDSDVTSTSSQGWGDWNGNTGSFSSNGTLTEDGFEYVFVDRKRSFTGPISLNVTTLIDTEGKIDFRRFSETHTRIEFNRDIQPGNTQVLVNGNILTGDAFAEQTWKISVIPDFENQSSRVFINGVDYGSFAFRDGISTLDNHNRILFSVGGTSATNRIEINSLYEGAYSSDGPEIWNSSFTGPSRTSDGLQLVQFDVEDAGAGELELTVQGSNDGSNWVDVDSKTITSSSQRYQTLTTGDYEYNRVRGTFVKGDRSDVVRIHDIKWYADVSAPSVSNSKPSDGAQVASYEGDVMIDVSDPDFGRAHGDSLSISLDNQDGDAGSTTINANGTATISYSPLAGQNSLEWTVTDAYGQSTTFSSSFSTPAELVLRTETNPSQTIDDSGTAEVTFFSDTTVETREITNGTADLSGLPADETFVAVVDMDGYYQRRVLIEDLFTQQRVFLLNESETAVDVEFRLDDSTGQFSGGDVELTVEKAIVINNSTEFRTVVGDRISASGGLPASLEQGARYRLTVSKDGNTRSLGSWTASSSGFVTLPIGRVEISGELNDEGWLLEHSIDEPGENSNADGILRLKYIDKANRTDSIETQVVRLDESGNVSEVVLANATETDSQSVVRSVEVNNTSDTFEVRYTLQRGGETITGQRKLGALEGITLPVDAGWLNLISWVAVFAFGGLVVIKDGRAAALVMAGTADLFAMLGWLQAPTAVLALGSAGAIVYAVAGYGGGY